MPPTETPPNPSSITPPPVPPPPGQGTVVAPIKVRAGRYGELEQHELLHLLDSIDDERSKGRFRESIYISLLVYLALAWFVLYGPRVLFHQGKLIMPADAIRQHEKELTFLDTPKDLPKVPTTKSPKVVTKPTLDKKMLEQLQAMRKAEEPAPRAAAAPLPNAPVAQPSPPPPAPAPAQPLPSAPTPLPSIRPATPSVSSVPDAPKPNFSTPATAGDSMRQLAENASKMRGSGGAGRMSAPVGHTGAAGAVEVLSDTEGVDFGPYINRLLIMIKAAWIPLIPEETEPPLNKEGMTLIRFRIEPNGRLSYMHLDDSTHDTAIDKAAWGSITSQGQFPPLPADFKGPNLDLRIQFVISHKYANER